METNLEFARLTIAAPRYAPPPAQQRVRNEQAAILGRARSLETCRAWRGACCGADKQTRILENIAWLALAICSGVVLMLSL
jgi:hypothetical protein